MKVGDRVRTLTSGGYSAPELQAGVTGVIVKQGFSYKGFEIRMDSGYEDEYGDDLWPFYDEELEVIQ